jgi:hypothetical protein
MADKETVELIMKVVTDQFSKELKGVQEQMRRMPDVRVKVHKEARAATLAQTEALTGRRVGESQT